MTQSSLAVSLDGRAWSVLNASPDIRAQIERAPALHPRALRDTPIASVLLTNADIDHIAGLLSLREKTAFELRATGEILSVLAANPVFSALAADVVARRPVALDAPFALQPGLEAELFAVPGKVALFLEGEAVQTDLMGEQTVGVRLSDGTRVAYYIPGCAEVTPDLAARIADADLLFFDGTVWADDEMIRAGTGVKTGRRMGHVPIDGPDGSLARLAGLAAERVFIHINNTNPILMEDSPQRLQLESEGIEVAYDGMDVNLGRERSSEATPRRSEELQL